MVSGLRLAFVTTKTGWPDGDAGCGSSWTQPVTTTNLGFFDCPAAVAARQRHVATTTIPVGLICTSEEPVRIRVCNRSATQRGRIPYPTLPRQRPAAELTRPFGPGGDWSDVFDSRVRRADGRHGKGTTTLRANGSARADANARAVSTLRLHGSPTDRAHPGTQVARALADIDQAHSEARSRRTRGASRGARGQACAIESSHCRPPRDPTGRR